MASSVKLWNNVSTHILWMGLLPLNMSISMVYSYNEGYIADNFIFKILDVNSAFETYTFVKQAKDIPFNAMFHQRERNIVFITLLE